MKKICKIISTPSCIRVSTTYESLRKRFKETQDLLNDDSRCF